MQTQTTSDAAPAKDSHQRIVDLAALQAAQVAVLNILREIEREKSFLPPTMPEPDAEPQLTAPNADANLAANMSSRYVPDILDDFRTARS